MNVMLDMSIVPMGVGVSVSAYVAECQRVLKNLGFDPKMHAYGTTIEGQWDNVFEAVRKCHEVLHGMGVPRISTSIRMGTRTDKDQSARDKVESVEQKLTGST